MRMHSPLIVVTFGLVACGAESGQMGVVVRDSAGITIIEHTDQPAPMIWTLSSEPVVTIGVRDGSDAQMLFRVAAAFRLDDGRLVIANGGSTEFRFYNGDGEHLASVGGAGGGPGEMRVLFEVTRLAGDTLVAFDPATGRLDWFDPMGAFIHRTSVDLRGLLEPPHFSDGAHLLPDRTFLLRVYEGSRSNLPDGVFRSNLGFFRYDATSAVVDTLTWVGGLENFVIHVGGRTVPGVRPFARRALEVWGPNAVYVVDTDRYEIQVFGLEPASRSLIRRAQDGPVVSASDRQAFVERYRGFIAQNPGRQGDMERWLAAVTYPETKPPISRLQVDRLGRLWVGETPAKEMQPVVWSVFGTAGRIMAQVEMPAAFTPMDIGADYVLGRVRDADDIEYIQMYELVQ